MKPTVPQSSSSIQEKSSQHRARPTPVAPKPYRPQATPKCLQRKVATPKPPFPVQVNVGSSPPSAHRPLQGLQRKGAQHSLETKVNNTPGRAVPAGRAPSVQTAIPRNARDRSGVIQRVVDPNPAGPIVLGTSLHPDSLYDFQIGGVGQTYYGAMNLTTGVMYLVPSVDPEGRSFTDTKLFRQVAMTETHGKHMLPSAQMQIGAGHMNALIMSNHYFNIASLKSDCAAFSITKTGSGRFNFVGNSGINEMGSFRGHTSRALPAAWSAFIEAQLATLVPRDLAPNKCVIL